MNEMPAITRHPYSVAAPRRGADAIIPFLACLRDQGINCYIAGGFARWILSPNDLTPIAGDVDIFFYDESGYRLAVDVLVGYSRFTLNLETKNAVTLSPPDVGFWSPISVQLIKPIKNRVGHMFDVMDGFDLNICQAAVQIAQDKDVIYGYVSQDFIMGEDVQKLKIINCPNPLALMQRCCKYAAKGYKISSNELMKIFLAWDKKDYSHRVKMNELMEDKNYQQIYDLLDI